jgi:hypothetical protein
LGEALTLAKSSTWKKSFVVLLITLVTGCTQIPEERAYKEPELSPNELATLTVLKVEFGSGMPNIGNVRVASIDGKLLDTSSGGFGQRYRKIRPGLREIVASIRYDRGGFFPNHEHVYMEFPILIEAGNRYEVRGSWSKNVSQIWVENTATGAIVGRAMQFQEAPK